MNNFSKNRNLNGINITGEAKAEIPVDNITFFVQVMATGDKKEERDASMEQQIPFLTWLIEDLNLETQDGYYWSEYYQQDCWFINGNLGIPCITANITLVLSGENLFEKGKTFAEKINALPRATLNNQMLSVKNIDPYLPELREKAIADAEEKADTSAKALWVRLGKLLVNSENIIDGSYDNNGLTRYVDGNGKWNLSQTLELKLQIHQTYAID